MKTVFITGGSTGIGAASVKKFIQQGWNVGFMDINEEAARERMEEINRPEQLILCRATLGTVRHPSCRRRNREEVRPAGQRGGQRGHPSLQHVAGHFRRGAGLDDPDQYLRYGEHAPRGGAAHHSCGRRDGGYQRFGPVVRW